MLGIVTVDSQSRCGEAAHENYSEDYADLDVFFWVFVVDGILVIAVPSIIVVITITIVIRLAILSGFVSFFKLHVFLHIVDVERHGRSVGALVPIRILIGYVVLDGSILVFVIFVRL